MKNEKKLTEDEVRKIISAVWHHEISGDEAFDVLWGEAFEGYTRKIADSDKETK